MLITPTATFLLAIASTILGTKSPSCYTSLEQCAEEANATAALDVHRINSSTVEQFCWNYTNILIPCLGNATKMIEDTNSFNESHILSDCLDRDKANYNETGEVRKLTHIMRLYMFACAVKIRSNLSNEYCFSKLLKHCVFGRLPARNCHYWQCVDRIEDQKYIVVKAAGDETNYGELSSDYYFTTPTKLSDADELKHTSHTSSDDDDYGSFQATTSSKIRLQWQIDMSNTDREDRLLDPTRRQFAHLIVPNYFLQYTITGIFIAIGTSF